MLEIIAKIHKLGSISRGRNQTIELSDVAIMKGDYCDGETRRIIFLNPKESEEFDKKRVG